MRAPDGAMPLVEWSRSDFEAAAIVTVVVPRIVETIVLSGASRGRAPPRHSPAAR
jgi:hypothetical protein